MRLVSDVKHLTVADPDAEEEDAVEDVVSPERLKAEREADGSFSDDSERSMSEGDVSLAESDISESNDPEHEEEGQAAPFGARIRNSLSSLGGFLPNLLRSPTKESAALSEEAEEEEDIVDLATSKGGATGVHLAVKTEPVEEDAHEEIHFQTDSEDQDEDDSASELEASDNDIHHEAEASEEMVANQLEDVLDVPEQDEPSGSDDEDVHTPTEAEAAHVDIKDAQAIYAEAADKVSPPEYFDKDIKPNATPTQPRRLVCSFSSLIKSALMSVIWQNAFMTPQVARPNFPRLAAGRKSVAVGNPTGATGDMSWLPGRVPVSAQPVESEEEVVEDAPEDVVEEVQAAPPVINKAVQGLALEEKVCETLHPMPFCCI